MTNLIITKKNIYDRFDVMNKNNLPKKIPIFPLSNFIIFPKTSVPLNIFEKNLKELNY